MGCLSEPAPRGRTAATTRCSPAPSTSSAHARERKKENSLVAYTALALPDASRYPHSGLSNFLDVQVDTTTDAVAVRAQVPNPDGLLTAGGVVRVTVERGAPRSALTIPQSAVLLDQAGRYVVAGQREEEGRAAPRNHRDRAGRRCLDGNCAGDNHSPFRRACRARTVADRAPDNRPNSDRRGQPEPLLDAHAGCLASMVWAEEIRPMTSFVVKMVLA
jgi:hypothetical protein